jgi:arylsulfatase A-like enzyme
VGGRSLRDGFRGSGALLGVLACLAILLAAGCSGSDSYQEQAEAPTNQPNIIFVLTDDLDYASAYRMPSINSLLREQGADFDSAFVSYPLCCPSRATILTGLYAHNHGVNGNNPPDGGFPKFRSEGLEAKTIAVRLQQSGYRTAFFGKYLNHYPGDAPATYVTPGWDEWYLKRNANKMYDYRISENGKIVSYGSETEDYYTDVLSDQATDFIRRTASGCKPFFMYVAPTAPHLPADPAERHKDAFAGESPPGPCPSTSRMSQTSRPRLETAVTSPMQTFLRSIISTKSV